ncbi:unnamed protein product, partial [marine sediment metagenome]
LHLEALKDYIGGATAPAKKTIELGDSQTFISKKAYGSSIVSISEKTIEAVGLTSLANTLSGQSRYDEALVELRKAQKLFSEAKELTDNLSPPPQYQKSYDYHVKALNLDIKGVQLDIQAREHLMNGEYELANLELEQAIEAYKEAISYAELSLSTMR